LRAQGVGVWFALAVLALVVAWPAAGRARAAEDPGELLVADLRGRSLNVVDLELGSVTDRIALPGGPHELLALPGGRVLVSLEQAGLLALVDLARREVETVEVGGLPHGLALDGDDVLVTDRAADTVRRFTLDGFDELPSTPAGTWPHAVATLPDGRIAVAAARSDALLLGDREIAVSQLPETVAVAPSRALIATAGAVGGLLHVLDGTGALVLELYLGGRPVRAVFAPDGESLAVALSAAAEVALVGLDGSVRRVAVSGVPDGLAFSKDGERLYASDVYGGSVTVIDLDAAVVVDQLSVGTSAGALLVR
jgi:DNA-binding beta-propeller fold protein YncE